jgi:hypothetical protein
MTFIASVIAKKGVAVIADSLVTSQMPILHYRKFLDHLNAQPKNEQGEISLDPNNIIPLFAFEPIYTKDYEEKLFRLNNFTAITTTGIAEINDKTIDDIVREFIGVQLDIEDFAIPIETKITQFKGYVTTQIKEHLEKYGQIGTCIFIITFYEKSTHKTHIHRLTSVETDKAALDNPDFDYILTTKEMDWVRVVCDGQNKLSDKVLYGIGKTLYDVFPAMVNNILERLNLPEGTVPEGFINQLIQDEFFKDIFFGDIELLNLSELSVQQAVDLASLLMRLEVDFQKYTKNIPTVGGVIKLAIIDDDGFKFISGHDVEKPKHINI